MHDFTIAPQLTALAEIFSENGARLYAVGGMVRNCLLGYPVNDTDVCSALRIEDVEAMLTARGIECRKKGAAFGTLDIEYLGDPAAAASTDGDDEADEELSRALAADEDEPGEGQTGRDAR